jgi:hypothetical protein
MIPEMTYNIYFSQDPIDDCIQVQVKDFEMHELMGMVFQQCEH